jgi:hypothetical protein
MAPVCLRKNLEPAFGYSSADLECNTQPEVN